MRVTKDQVMIKEFMLEQRMKELIDRTLTNDWDALAEFRALVPEVPKDAVDRLARYLEERTWSTREH